MSRFTNLLQDFFSGNTQARLWVLRGAAVLGAVLGFVWLRILATADPFAELRKSPSISASIGIRLDDVEVRHFSGDQLRARGLASRVDVRQDRQYMDIYGIKDGVFHTGHGDLKFSADKANWSAGLKRIEVTSGARVYGDKFDLKVSRFFVDQPTSALHVPGQLVGKLVDGNVIASNLTYRLDNGNYVVGPAEWEGMLANPLQDQDANPKPTHWKIKCLGIMTHENDIDHWPDGEATDGDIIVKADLVERNTKTDVITATGKVRYFSAKTNLTCARAVIYRKEKRALFTENVHMVFKPEDQQSQPLMVIEIPPFQPVVPEEIAKNRPPAPPPGQSKAEKDLDEQLRSGGNAKKYPVTSMSQKVEYWYGKGSRHAIITGNPQARQELPGSRWRHIWSPTGLYDGEKETLKLVSSSDKQDTRVKSSLGDDLTADWFQISTKDGDDKWSGFKIAGDVYPDDSELPREKKDDKTPKQPAPKTPASQPQRPPAHQES